MVLNELSTGSQDNLLLLAQDESLEIFNIVYSFLQGLKWL